MNTVIVLGASGATGNHVVNQLLQKKVHVKIIIRPTSYIPEAWINNKQLEIIRTDFLKLSNKEIQTLVKDCNAIVSCLGHNITFKGIYGQPRKLVRDTIKHFYNALISNKPSKPVKYVLMNSSGVHRKDLKESISLAQKMVLGLLRLFLPPHVDNEQSAAFLNKAIGQNNKYIQWVAVRPDGLINEDEITTYEAHPSPTRSAIFNAGKISRINVAHFMVELITNDDLWDKWKGKMPVLYDKP